VPCGAVLCHAHGVPSLALACVLLTLTPLRRPWITLSRTVVPLSLGEVEIIGRINLEKAPWRAFFCFFF
jgi:hypothetical protein